MDLMNMSRLDRFGTPYDKWARGNKRDAREAWRMVELVANNLGLSWKYLYTEDIFEEIAKNVADFKGMSYGTIGNLGQPIASKKETVVEPLYKEVYQESTERIESVGSVIL
jgi:predicted molibdopterin-dependent oxidoreductase YjgC